MFTVPDEFYWVTGSANFLQAIQKNDWEATYHAGQPGVTLMWVETLGFLATCKTGIFSSLDCKAFLEGEKTMSVLRHMRLIVVTTNALLVAGIAVMVRRIVSYPVAWISGFLLAFDAFLLTESRVVRTEGMVTHIGTAAVLVLLWYIQRPTSRRVLLLGIFTGLSLLSKISSLGLLPVGLLGILLAVQHLPPNTKTRQILLHTGLWSGAIIVTIFLVWPAALAAPLDVARKMYEFTFIRAVEGGGGARSFFWGKPTDDPGPFFYPVVLLFRTSPLLWVGLALAVADWLRKNYSGREKLLVGISALYIFIYLGIITASHLKFDRYIIPALPLLTIIAATGLVKGWHWAVGRWGVSPGWGAVASMALLGLQVALTVPHHPYYYTYYNPLLGGIRQARNFLPIGTGIEGVDQVAAYLNSLPAAETITVASANSQKLRPLFKGNTLPMTNTGGEWFLADYTFIYISQLQRGKHDPNIIQYLRRHPAVFELSLKGVEYGWVYKGPGAQFWGGDTTLEGRGTLYAYDLSATTIQAGTPLSVTVYFRNEGQHPTDRFYVRLVDTDGYIWAEGTVMPRSGFEDAWTQREAIVEGKAELPLPVGMPPGLYILKMGYEYRDTSKPIGEFILPDNSDDIRVTLPATFPPAPPGLSPSVNLTLDDELKLYGYRLDKTTLSASDSLWLTLYWQALKSVRRDYVIAVQLLDENETERAYWLGRPVRSGYPTNQWQAKQIVQDPWR
ncbi:MAG: phospholipid carrier-dependent glycosyltransferase, partial [Calditrichaeota bacterium]